MLVIIFLFFLTAYSLFPSNYYIIPQSSQIFTETFYASKTGPSCGAISPPAPLSCTLQVNHGGGVSTNSGGCNWQSVSCSCIEFDNNNNQCSQYKAEFKCEININIDGLVAGQGNAGLSCNGGYYSSSHPLLFDFKNPEIYNINLNPNSPSHHESFQFSYCVRDDNPDIECELRLNNLKIKTHQTGNSKSGCFTETISVNWGVHEIKVICKDKTRHPNWIGIKRNTTETIQYTRTTSQTVTVTLLSPVDLFATNNTTARPVNISFRVNNSPTEYVDCKIVNTVTNNIIANIDGVRNNSEAFYVIPQDFSDGVYTYRVECVDRGPRNIGKSEIRGFIIDREPPMIQIVYPAENSQIYDNPVELRALVNDAVPSPNSLNCTFRIDGNTFTFNDVSPGTTLSRPHNLNPNPSNKIFNVSCIDRAGNSNSTQISFNYKDGVPPRIRLISPINVQTTNNDINLEAEVYDDSNFVCMFYWKSYNDQNYNSRSISSGSPGGRLSVNINLPTYGSYEWYVECRDSNGNSARSNRVSFMRVFPNSGGSSGNIISCGMGSNQRIADVFGIAAVLGALLITFGLFAGKILNNQEIELGAKAELRSFIVTILVFAIIIFVSNAFYCSYMNDLLQSARANISHLSNSMNELIISTSRLYAMSMVLSSITPVEWSISMMIVEFNRRENFNKKIYDYGTNAQGILNLFVSTVFNLNYYARFVEFLVNYAYNFLLYVALIARVIPITKRIGSTLLGVSIALIFILPFVYNITTAILVDMITEGIIPGIETSIKNAEANLGKVYYTVAAILDRLNTWAFIMNWLQVGWTLIKFGFWLFLKICQIVGVCYPIALGLFIGWGDLLYGIFKLIGAVVWTLDVNNLQFAGTGGTQDALKAFEDILNYNTTLLLAFLNILNISYYLLNLIIVIVAIRSISLLGGGDYFLYGIEERL
ncbi:MAG: hypothetical protein QXH89_01565 [Candidatus Anstonellales archaeon]